MNLALSVEDYKDKIIGFIWQHVLLVISLFIMTFGVALCVRSALGSSVISTIPLVLSIAGSDDLIVPMTIGEWTYVTNFALVGLQIIILGKQFELVQLFQLVIGFFFGWLLDVNMGITSFIPIENLTAQLIAQAVGCIVLGIGIAFEIRCGSVTMPGEGLPAAISKRFAMPFAKAKIYVDISLVIIAVALGFLYFGRWLWSVVGPGTLFAMLFVGIVVKILTPHIKWFDKLLCYRPGFRRYIYGLARTIRYLTTNNDNKE